MFISFSFSLVFSETRSDIQLKLPINRSNLDIGCDQGYGSERSPEDELPPPLPLMSIPYQPEIHQPPWDYDKLNGCEYSFITKGNTFNISPKSIVCGGQERSVAQRCNDNMARHQHQHTHTQTHPLKPGGNLFFHCTDQLCVWCLHISRILSDKTNQNKIERELCSRSIVCRSVQCWDTSRSLNACLFQASKRCHQIFAKSLFYRWISFKIYTNT